MASLRKKNGRWQITYTGADGRTKRRVGFTDKQESARLARRLEDEARARRLGLLDDGAERSSKHASAPISEHVEAYRGLLESKGGDPRHVRETMASIHAVLETCEWATLQDLDGARFSAHLREYAQGRAARTVNARRQALRGFTRWLVANQRLDRDPFATVARAADHVKARERRALDDDEINRLIQATAQEPTRFRMGGERRAMLYRVAIGTGFRAGELASLTPRSFDLDAEDPTITIEAAYSKRRRRDIQPIRPDLAETLRPWLASQPLEKILWPIKGAKTARMIAADLEAAGVPVEDDAGRVCDFHALRHTYVTRLARAGVTPKVAQTLARHSTITLTMDRYAHVSLADHRRALDALPDVGPSPDARTHSAQIGGVCSPSPSSTGRTESAQTESPEARKPLQGKALGVSGQSLSFGGRNTGGRIRTPNLLIRSQAAICPHDSAKPDSGPLAHTWRTDRALTTLGRVEDPELAEVVEAWGSLEPAARGAIRAMIQAFGGSASNRNAGSA